MSDLHVDSVIKSFNTKQVLTNIYLSCKKGEIIGLLGRNGTGKSTLLKIIFGSLQADTKFIKIGDKLINGLFDNRKLVNYLPQNNFLPKYVKVRRIIDLFCNGESANKVKNHKLIGPLLNKKSHMLSGGEKRLLEVFLVIYSDVVFVLIDEPFNGISPVYKEEIISRIKEQSVNKGFIITDHDYRNVVDIATRLIVIHDGGTKEIKNKEELKYWGYLQEKVLL